MDTEFTTGDRQRGRIDTLGIDQDGTPVIIEYKKRAKENVINQGLFYLDWLVDHKGDFTLAAQKQLGKDIEIDWSSPRLILVAESFSEYDKYAVNRIGANIQLWTYRKYGSIFCSWNPYLRRLIKSRPKKDKTETKEDASEDNLEEEVVYTLEYHFKRKARR